MYRVTRMSIHGTAPRLHRSSPYDQLEHDPSSIQRIHQYGIGRRTGKNLRPQSARPGPMARVANLRQPDAFFEQDGAEAGW